MDVVQLEGFLLLTLNFWTIDAWLWKQGIVFNDGSNSKSQKKLLELQPQILAELKRKLRGRREPREKEETQNVTSSCRNNVASLESVVSISLPSGLVLANLPCQVRLEVLIVMLVTLHYEDVAPRFWGLSVFFEVFFFMWEQVTALFHVMRS